MGKRVGGQEWDGEDILKPLLHLGQSRRFVSWAERDAKGLDAGTIQRGRLRKTSQVLYLVQAVLHSRTRNLRHRTVGSTHAGQSGCTKPGEPADPMAIAKGLPYARTALYQYPEAPFPPSS
jgi:hypothetical protein